MFPERIQQMISLNALKANEFKQIEVANLWRKAIANAADAKLNGMSLDGSIQSAYTAVFHAALAILAQQGLRIGGARNHHENAFAAVDVFGIAGLDNVIPESSRFRSLRRSSMYDPDIASQRDRDEALKWLNDTLPKMYSALVGWNPELSNRITAP